MLAQGTPDVFFCIKPKYCSDAPLSLLHHLLPQAAQIVEGFLFVCHCEALPSCRLLPIIENFRHVCVGDSPPSATRTSRSGTILLLEIEAYMIYRDQGSEDRGCNSHHCLVQSARWRRVWRSITHLKISTAKIHFFGVIIPFSSNDCKCIFLSCNDILFSRL